MCRENALAACVLLLATALAASGAASTSKLVIKGRIVAVDTGLPIAGAKVKIKGLGTATTNRDGRYKIRAAAAPEGAWQVVISKRGYRRRKTWLVASESDRRLRGDWNLLPKTSDIFDVRLFDFAARLGRRTVGSSRWEQTPRFRIIANRLDCNGLLEPGEDNCPDWTVTSSRMGSTMMTWMLAAVESVPALTGGMIPTVEIVEFTPNTTVPMDSILVPGAFTFGEYAGLGGGGFPNRATGSSMDSYVFLITERGAFSPGHIVRRMAIGLGLRPWAPDELCAELLARDLRTVLCLTHGANAATNLDAVIGRALYTRAVGNRFPDTDPAPDSARRRLGVVAFSHAASSTSTDSDS